MNGLGVVGVGCLRVAPHTQHGRLRKQSPPIASASHPTAATAQTQRPTNTVRSGTHLRALAELLLENAERARAAHVVRHELVDLRPDVVAGAHDAAARAAREDLLGERHRRLDLLTFCLRCMDVG